MKFEDELVKSLPIWIRLSKLKLQYFNPLVLGKLASLIGKPLLVDEATANEDRLDFARICIEISPSCTFPKNLSFWNEDGNEEVIDVEYEWRPSRCSHCISFGHSNARCSFVAKPSKTWVPKPHQIRTQEKSDALKQPILPIPPPSQPSTSTSNAFVALETLDDNELELPIEDANAIISSSHEPLVMEKERSNVSNENGSTHGDINVESKEKIGDVEPTLILQVEEVANILREDISGEDGLFDVNISSLKTKRIDSSKLLSQAKNISLKEMKKAAILPKRGRHTKSPPPKASFK